jgi:hypothetical protein
MNTIEKYCEKQNYTFKKIKYRLIGGGFKTGYDILKGDNVFLELEPMHYSDCLYWKIAFKEPYHPLYHYKGKISMKMFEVMIPDHIKNTTIAGF